MRNIKRGKHLLLAAKRAENFLLFFFFPATHARLKQAPKMTVASSAGLAGLSSSFRHEICTEDDFRRRSEGCRITVARLSSRQRRIFQDIRSSSACFPRQSKLVPHDVADPRIYGFSVTVVHVYISN